MLGREPLPEGQEEAFRRESLDVNVGRLRPLLPAMAAVHAAHAIVFSLGADADPVLQAWRSGVIALHEVTAAFAVALALTAWGWFGDRARDLTPDLAALGWTLHAAAIVGVDQTIVTSVTPFVGYVGAIPLLLPTRPLRHAPVALLGLAAFVASVSAFQPDPSALRAALPNGFSVTVAAVFLNAFVDGARRRDFGQRATIEAQRAALARLAADLEQRVREQVGEILARAREIETLNARLTARITERSVDLDRALTALAARSGGPGVGAVLGGRYALGEVLGRGGMGVVHAGVDRATGEDVAVKLIHPRSAHELDALRRLLLEARAAAAVVHPAVVRVHAVDLSEDGVLYLVLERVRGETLHDAVNRLGEMPLPVAARIGEVLARGLAAAHQRGIVHRDVKPANVMLTATAPGLRLLDFGIALGRPAEDDATLALDGPREPVLGTPGFVDPATLRGAPPSPASDVYAVGVTLFLLALGRLPAPAEAPRHPEDGPLPGLDPALEPIVRACLAADPARRPTASDVAEALGRVAGPAPLEAHVSAGFLAQPARTGSGPTAEPTVL